ncbi:MAG: hypothetical protein QNJ53_20400 [Pleurocapsa sp. MO_192.B19]|nr:hypothetical protein [Pleurocapsa sp. MO_192.B19]
MKPNSTLLKAIPLMILMAGLVKPVKIAQAAGSDSSHDAPDEKKAVNSGELTEEHKEANGIVALLTSKKAKQIEFFAFLGTLGCSIIVPELLYKSKESNQSLESSEHDQDLQDTPTLKVVTENTKGLNLVSDNSEQLNVQETVEFEDQGDQDQKAA